MKRSKETGCVAFGPSAAAERASFERAGFTLVELLVVIAIIGVLVALLLPAVQAAREAARRTQCVNNLKQLGLAAQNYVSANGALPQGYGGGSAAGFRKEGVLTVILPYMEQSAVYDLIIFDYADQGIPYFDDPARDVVVAAYICPSLPEERVYVDTSLPPFKLGAISTYNGVGGAVQNRGEVLAPSGFGPVPDNGAFLLREDASGAVFGVPRKLGQITDGLSNSFLFGEFVHRDCEFGAPIEDPPGNVRPWYLSGFTGAPYQFKVLEDVSNACVSRAPPDAIQFNYLPMGSFHPGITLFAFVDGSVHPIMEGIALETYKALATVNGEEVIDAP